MKAAIYRRYGPPDVVQLEDVAKPVPKDNEILVRVHATTVCATDSRVRKADYFIFRLFIGLLKPRKPVIAGLDAWFRSARTSHASKWATSSSVGRAEARAHMSNISACLNSARWSSSRPI